MAKKKKTYVEEQIFSIYSDFPVLVNDEVVWDDKKKPLHFHYYLEIGYCFEGSGVLSSSKQEMKVKKGDITIIAPNLLHTMNSDEGVHTRWGNIFIDIDDLIKLFPASDLKAQLQMVQKSFKDILCLKYENRDEHSDILWLIEEVIRLNREKKQSYKAQILGLLYVMVYKVHDKFSDEDRGHHHAKDLPIMPAIEYIFDHYMEPIKVGDLAKVCHFSESYFRKVFLEMKGMGPMDYVNSIRIREACRMLLNSTDTVRMVGEKCGYPSVTTFERNFRQRTGMLPSQWRDKQKNLRKKDRDMYDIKRVFYKDI